MSKILICGAGAIGSNLATLLAADLHGKHEITVLDFDKVEERNVQAGTQFYQRDQIGMSKVVALQYNIYKWFERDCSIVEHKLERKDTSVFGLLSDSNLIIDCFDNSEARKLLQEHWEFHKDLNRTGTPCDVLHIGFSDQFTFAIEWAENYTVPTDITSGFDVCEALGASSFTKTVAGLAGSTVCDYLETGKKHEFIGNRFNIKQVI